MDNLNNLRLKKSFLFACICCLSFCLQAQDERNNILSKQNEADQNHWRIELSGALGFAQLYTEKYQNIHVNTSFSEMLLAYRCNAQSHLKIGLDFLKFNTTSVQDSNYTNIEVSSLQIPLKYSIYIPYLSTERAKIMVEFGTFASYHLKNKTENNLNTSEEKHVGWYFGACLNIGIDFQIHDNWSFALGIEHYLSHQKLNPNHLNFRVDNNRLLKLSLIFLM